ncbi:zinc carboxypeptidase A 1-like [Eurosta solidaginis]|uniref:zinc carboxypeptidase A 1-like n=1 Tax=Eurosta solidaginis TaxID=178769 RepID=UPI003530FAA3
MWLKISLIFLIGFIANLDYGYAQEASNVEKEFNKNYDWKKYHELNETYDWLRALAKLYPKQVSLFVAGQTYEGREMLGVRIAFDNGKKATGKRPSVFLEGGMHAREWISPAVTTYITNQLLTSTDERVRNIAESHIWYAVPHTNPDGYVYTHTTDRLWRKTRKPYGKCFGADPNRNFDFQWNTTGTSNDPCDDLYAGPSPYSEIETRTYADFVTKLKDELVLHLQFHAYGQRLLFPYGYTKTLPPTYNNLKRVSDVAVPAITKRYGTPYTGGAVSQIEYEDSGSVTDWAYGKLNIPYVYCYELRPPDDAPYNAFLLPENQIRPTAEETMDSMVAMVEEIDLVEK